MSPNTTIRRPAYSWNVVLRVAAVVCYLASRSGWATESAVVMTTFEQQEIVNIHNMLRRGENSSNMEMLKWSRSLSSAAQNWSNRCDWKRGIALNSSTLSDLGIGQNLYGYKPPPINLTTAVLFWFKQKANYSYVNDACINGQLCLNYKQIVLAETREVGCGYTVCPSLTGLGWTNAVFLVCNYAPVGKNNNIPIYRVGPPCTQCLSGQFYCNNGLCDESCVAPSTNCVCSAVCKNSATVTADCRCRCLPGWTNGDCSVPAAGTSTTSPTTAVAMETTRRETPVSSTGRDTTTLGWSTDTDEVISTFSLQPTSSVASVASSVVIATTNTVAGSTSDATDTATFQPRDNATASYHDNGSPATTPVGLTVGDVTTSYHDIGSSTSDGHISMTVTARFPYDITTTTTEMSVMTGLPAGQPLDPLTCLVPVRSQITLYHLPSIETSIFSVVSNVSAFVYLGVQRSIGGTWWLSVAAMPGNWPVAWIDEQNVQRKYPVNSRIFTPCP